MRDLVNVYKKNALFEALKEALAFLFSIMKLNFGLVFDVARFSLVCPSSNDIFAATGRGQSSGMRLS